jgi:hypothetical protein
MSHRVQQNIKFTSPTRRCPYCHDRIKHSDRKCVCNSCLAASHVSCWDEDQCCASCAGTERLIQENGQSHSALAVGAEAQPLASRSADAPLALARDHSATTNIAPDCDYTRARLSDRFRSLISAEGQSELRQKAAQRQLKDPWDITENTTLMLSVILLAAMLLMPFLGRFRILSIAPVIFAFIAWSTNKNRAIEREIEETEFIPIPVKIREQSRTDKDGLQHLVCELDPMSNELPESFYPIHEDKEQRVVGIDVRAEVSQGLGHGDLALLVTYKTTVLALEPVK